MEVIGLDIGHSAVKVSAGGKQMIFPTAATLAVELGMDEAAQQAKADLVNVDGHDFFVGDTALIHTNGNLLDGLRDDWIETREHIALLVSGYQRGKAATGEDDIHLVVGLPSRLHLSQHVRLRELAAMHLQIEPARVSVLPQPLGAFMATVLGDDGAPIADRNPGDERWGVIDIGYYTADFGLIENGVWSAAGAKSHQGANQMAEMIRIGVLEKTGVNLPLRDADKVLRTRATKLYGKVIDLSELVDNVAQTYSNAIVEHAINVFGQRLPSLDGIIIAGGAAELIHRNLKREWKHAITTKASRFTVAEGMRRYGLMKQIKI